MEKCAELFRQCISAPNSKLVADPYKDTLHFYLQQNPEISNVDDEEILSNAEISLNLENKFSENSLAILREIVVDWAQACNVFPLPKDTKVSDIQRDIESTLVAIRCSAIVSSVWYRDRVDDEDVRSNLVYQLMHHMIIDESRLARMAATLAIHAWAKNCDSRVDGILEEKLQSPVDADSWAAARCLVHFWRPFVKDKIINVIVKHITTTDKEEDHQKGFDLLKLMSDSSDRIETAILRKLSTEDISVCFIACQALAHVPVVNSTARIEKLRAMMKKNCDSRLLDAAAGLLNSMGCEDLVKGAIVKLLSDQSVTDKTTNALVYMARYVGKSLNPRWIPIILCCLKHDSPAVRSLACLVVGRQCFNNKHVISGLAELAYEDNDQSVQENAISVLYDLGIFQ